jgi:hypothetical protein
MEQKGIYVAEFLEKYPNEGEFIPRAHAVCADGFVLSIQNNVYNHSKQYSCEIWCWTWVDDIIEELGGLDMANEDSGPLDYVKWEDIDRILELHGGIIRAIPPVLR